VENLISGEALPWVYSIGLLILGLVLILLEVFVIPGLNIFGIIGFGTVCVGVLFAYTRLGPEAAAVIGVLGFGGTGALVWLLIRNRAWQRMVRDERTDRASGYDSATGELEGLVGQIGTASTALRPAGRAQFGDRVVDVVADGGFIALGAAIEVLEVHGNRVVVHERAESQV
jgi:membrane-bound serine protease (ClpP class)